MLRMCLVVWAVFVVGPFGEANQTPPQPTLLVNSLTEHRLA
jgi:hypothetical protein